MLYCEKCGVYLSGSMERCPLCQGAVTGQPEEDAYPPLPETARPYGLTVRLAGLLTAAALTVCAAVNYCFPEGGWWFLFVAAGLVSKIVGCGAAAKVCGFNAKDSLKIGIGMIARGEVALIVAQKGIESGIVPSVYLSAVIVLVIVSSLLAPVLLKLLFKADAKREMLIKSA